MGKLSKATKIKKSAGKSGIKWKGAKNEAPGQRLKGNQDRMNTLRLERLIERESTISLINWIPPPPPKPLQPFRIDEDGFTIYKRKARSGPENWKLRGAARPWESLNDGTLDPNGRPYDIIPDGKNMFQTAKGNFWYENNDTRKHIENICELGNSYKVLNKEKEYLDMHCKALELDYSDCDDNINKSSCIVLLKYLIGYNNNNGSDDDVTGTGVQLTSKDEIMKTNDKKTSKIIIQKNKSKLKTNNNIKTPYGNFIRIENKLKIKLINILKLSSEKSFIACYCLLLLSCIYEKGIKESNDNDNTNLNEESSFILKLSNQNESNVDYCLQKLYNINPYSIIILYKLNLFHEAIIASSSLSVPCAEYHSLVESKEESESDITVKKDSEVLETSNSMEDEDTKKSMLTSSTSTSSSSLKSDSLQTNNKNDINDNNKDGKEKEEEEVQEMFVFNEEWKHALKLMKYWEIELKTWEFAKIIIIKDMTILLPYLNKSIIKEMKNKSEIKTASLPLFKMNEGIPDDHFPAAKRFISALKKTKQTSK